MKKATGCIVAASVIAAASVLSACTPQMPPEVQAARAEQYVKCESGDQEVSANAEYAAAIEAVNNVLSVSCPEQSMTVVGPSEKATVKILDHAPTAEDLAAMKAVCGAEVRYVPIFGTPVGLAYNLPGMDGIILSPAVVAQILSGSITTWNDPRIAADNEGFDLPDTAIKVAKLEAPTGAVEAMTAWLTKAAPQAWSAGEVAVLPNGSAYADFPAFLEGLTGMPPIDPNAEVDLDADVPDINTDAEGTVAVLPLFTATENALSVADFLVDGTDVTPSISDYSKIGISVMETSTDANGNILGKHAVGGVPAEGQFDAQAAQVVLEEGQPIIGWPVIATSTILACDDPSKPLPLSTAQFWIRLAGQGTLDSIGLTPIPESLRISTFPALKFSLDGVDESQFSDSASPSGDGSSDGASDAASDAPSDSPTE